MIQVSGLYSNFRTTEKIEYLIELKLWFSRHMVQACINNCNIKFYFVLNIPHVLKMFTYVIAH